MIYSRIAEAYLNVEELNADFEFPMACKLLTIYLHSTVAITEDVTLTFKSKDGAEFDTVLDTRRMTTEENFVYAAAGILGINEGDRINVNVTNANLVGIVRVTIKAETT